MLATESSCAQAGNRLAQWVCEWRVWISHLGGKFELNSSKSSFGMGTVGRVIGRPVGVGVGAGVGVVIDADVFSVVFDENGDVILIARTLKFKFGLLASCWVNF